MRKIEEVKIITVEKESIVPAAKLQILLYLVTGGCFGKLYHSTWFRYRTIDWGLDKVTKSAKFQRPEYKIWDWRDPPSQVDDSPLRFDELFPQNPEPHSDT